MVEYSFYFHNNKFNKGIKTLGSLRIKGEIINSIYGCRVDSIPNITLFIKAEQIEYDVESPVINILKIPDTENCFVRLGGPREFKIIGNICIVKDIFIKTFHTTFESACSTEMKSKMEK